MTATEVTILRRTHGDSSTVIALCDLWRLTVGTLHSAYTLGVPDFRKLLRHPAAVAFIAEDSERGFVGFALTYTIRAGAETNPAGQHLKGTLSALVVLPEARGRGIGTLLHNAALDDLTAAVRDSLSRSSPPAPESVIQLGSVFPRIFPGVPALDAFLPAKSWFERRGWVFNSQQAIDLYGKLPTEVDQEQFKTRPHSFGISFRPATPTDRAGIMALQKEFDSFTGWPDMFPKFFDAGNWADIHLAVTKEGRIIGATFAALPKSPLHDLLVWPDGLGNKCGAIACVGVSSSSRGEGAGVGMVASALQDLERRGADGCFIDWVSMQGFYERFGLARWEAPYWESNRKVTAESTSEAA